MGKLFLMAMLFAAMSCGDAAASDPDRRARAALALAAAVPQAPRPPQAPPCHPEPAVSHGWTYQPARDCYHHTATGWHWSSRTRTYWRDAPAHPAPSAYRPAYYAPSFGGFAQPAEPARRLGSLRGGANCGPSG